MTVSFYVLGSSVWGFGFPSLDQRLLLLLFFVLLQFWCFLVCLLFPSLPSFLLLRNHMLVLDVTAAVGMSFLLSRQCWSICWCVFVFYIHMFIHFHLWFFMLISSVPLLDTPGFFFCLFLSFSGELSESWKPCLACLMYVKYKCIYGQWIKMLVT